MKTEMTLLKWYEKLYMRYRLVRTRRQLIKTRELSPELYFNQMLSLLMFSDRMLDGKESYVYSRLDYTLHTRYNDCYAQLDELTHMLITVGNFQHIKRSSLVPTNNVYTKAIPAQQYFTYQERYAFDSYLDLAISMFNTWTSLNRTLIERNRQEEFNSDLSLIYSRLIEVYHYAEYAISVIIGNDKEENYYPSQYHEEDA